MQIECPSCHTRAQISESKEGAKVRCGSCGRVYVARDRVHGGAVVSGSPALKIVLGAGAVVVAAVAIFVFTRERPAPAPVAAREPEAPAPAAPDPLEQLGWNGELVRTAVALHDAAFAGSRDKLRESLHGPRSYSKAVKDAKESGADFPFEAELFVDLTPADQLAWLDGRVDELLTGDAADYVVDWQPYDGQVEGDLDPNSTHVRISATPRGGGAEKRTVDWWLAKDGGAWKAYAWERWLSDAEKRALRPKRDKGFEQVTLSDGSIVLERQPERLEHLETTPPELRARIDERLATMIDLDETFGAQQAMRDLVDIGRPAIPALLTALYEIPVATHEQAIQVNLVVKALREISGQSFGYRPEVAEGSAFGTTLERRTSAIKQWFAWWHRSQDEFTERPEPVDELEKLVAEEERAKAE